MHKSHIMKQKCFESLYLTTVYDRNKWWRVARDWKSLTLWCIRYFINR